MIDQKGLVREERARVPGVSYSWGPRPALDGVRAIAVYLVVLFHGGLAAFEGGFIGVDLFFTLSGFLVTNMMLVDIARHGRLRLARFYARRFRRLLPAAAVAIVGIAVASLLVLTPLERATLIPDARAALLYFANWHFIGGATDYFAVEATQASPYLHFWSLSIEEQFYFVFPWVLVGLLTLRRRTRRPGIPLVGLVLLGAVSLASQLFWAGENTVRAYYGTDARLYQLFAGAALAVAFQRWGAPQRFRRAAGPGALVAIVAFTVAATSFVDVTPAVRGVLAMVCAVAILAALELDTDSPAAATLSRRTMTYLGRISYGTYLWHWPVIVFAKRLGDFGALELALLSCVIGTALAALSNEIVEMPVRHSAMLERFPRPVIVTGLVAGAVLALAVVPLLLTRDQAPAVAVRGQGVDVAGGQARDWGDVPQNVSWAPDPEDRTPEPPDCSEGPAEDCIVVRGSGQHVHLLGDSHARMLLPTLRTIAERRDMTLSASYDRSCPWQEGLLLEDAQAKGAGLCSGFKADQYERVIPELDADIVVVISAPRDDPNGAPQNRQHDGGHEAVRTTTAASVAKLAEGGRRVVLIEPVPYWPFEPRSCLSAAKKVAECAFKPAKSPLPSEVIYRYEALRDGVFSIDLDPVVCPDLPMCVPWVKGMVAFTDRHHIGLSYAEHIAPALDRRFEAAGVYGDTSR